MSLAAARLVLEHAERVTRLGALVALLFDAKLGHSSGAHRLDRIDRRVPESGDAACLERRMATAALRKLCVTCVMSTTANH